MKNKLAKLVDVKSIVTLVLVAALAFLVIYSAITGKDLSNNVFLLFSNVVTMIVTFFFTKKSTDSTDDGSPQNTNTVTKS